MSDGFLFEARYNGVRLDVVSASTAGGRDVVSHTSPNRDGADLEDQGLKPKVFTLTLIFFDHDFTDVGEGDYIARFQKFIELEGSGLTRTLLHPYYGIVPCKLESFTDSASAESGPFIRGSATFKVDRQRPPAFPSGPGVHTTAAAADVSNSRVALDATLGTPSLVAADADAAALDWETNPERTAREVQLEAASLSDRLNTESEGVGDSFDLFEAQKQYAIMAATIRRLSEAFSASTNRIFELTVNEPTPLLIIASRFYGADEAEERKREMIDLNPRLRRTSLIPAGTVIKAYSPLTSVGSLDVN